MKVIEAFAQIMTSEGEAAAGLSVDLEVFVLASRRWTRIGSAKANAKGIWQAKAKPAPNEFPYAPILRLTESGTVGPRVIAQNCHLSYNPTNQTLTADFGQVELLGEAAHSLKASNVQLRRLKHVVAGQPKQATAVRPSRIRPPNITPADSSATVDTFNSEMMKFKVREAELQTKLNQSDQELKKHIATLATEKKRIKSLETQIAKLIATETRLKKENAIYTDEEKRKTPIQDIVANIGTVIDSANNKLANEKRPYQFGRIEVDLKGTLSKDGQSMAFLNMAELREIPAGGALSGLKVELLPQRGHADTTTQQIVPDVTGLTETAVRRVLNQVGLRLEAISKSESKVPIGQAMSQSPKPGDNAPQNKTVLVVFAAP